MIANTAQTDYNFSSSVQYCLHLGKYLDFDNYCQPMLRYLLSGIDLLIINIEWWHDVEMNIWRRWIFLFETICFCAFIIIKSVSHRNIEKCESFLAIKSKSHSETNVQKVGVSFNKLAFKVV